MSASAIQTNFVSTDYSVFRDLLDDKVEAMRAVMRKWIPGLGQIRKGITAPDDEDAGMVVPGIQIQARNVVASMKTTGKTSTFFTVDMVCYQGDNDPEMAIMKGTSVSMNLRKLFSNNALNDISAGDTGFGVSPYGTDAYGDPYPAAGTNSFKVYLPYWINSEQKRNEILPLYKFWRDDFRFVSIVLFQLVCETFDIIQPSS